MSIFSHDLHCERDDFYGMDGVVVPSERNEIEITPEMAPGQVNGRLILTESAKLAGEEVIRYRWGELREYPPMNSTARSPSKSFMRGWQLLSSNA